MQEKEMHYYRCYNKECCDGQYQIGVIQDKETKTHYCSWCGELCTPEAKLQGDDNAE